MSSTDTPSKFPIVDDFRALLKRADATSDLVRRAALRAKADRLLSVMTAAAAREALRYDNRR